ncbi:MAG: hypothetical protein LC115_05725 [Bacteroidia bacterium]|nr:hypothetical protein [Bacteroidia bacterium]
MFETVPAWVRELQSQSIAGIHWLSGTEQEEFAEKLHHSAEMAFELVPTKEQDKEIAIETLRQAIPVAVGSTCSNGMGMSWTSNILFHSDSPDQLFLQLFHEYPFLFWIPLGNTASEIEETLSAYFPRVIRPKIESFTKTYRFFLCQANSEISQLTQLAHYFRENLFCDEVQWGNIQQTDPFVGRLPNYQEITETREAYTLNSSNLIPTLSFRTRHTNSIIKIEDHQAVFMAEIRYNPVKPSPLISYYNESYETHFLEDIPVDIVATLLGFPVRRY